MSLIIKFVPSPSWPYCYVGTCCCFFPVAIGRYALHLVGLVDAPVMYTASIGLYIIWIAIRLLTTLISHALQGMELFWRQVVLWMDVLVKCGFAGVIFFIIIPLFMGHLVELILLSPLRVPFDKLPVFYPSTVSWNNDILQHWLHQHIGSHFCFCHLVKI